MPFLSSPLRRTLYYRLPLLVWLSIIFVMSGDGGSAAHTRPMVRSILRYVLPSVAARLSPDQVERIDYDLRKSCHVIEYGILSVFAFHAITSGSFRFRSRQVLFPVLLGIGYAALDEYHQSFIPSRWGVAADLVFDSLGAVSGTCLSLWLWELKREKAATK